MKSCGNGHKKLYKDEPKPIRIDDFVIDERYRGKTVDEPVIASTRFISIPFTTPRKKFFLYLFSSIMFYMLTGWNLKSIN